MSRSHVAAEPWRGGGAGQGSGQRLGRWLPTYKGQIKAVTHCGAVSSFFWGPVVGRSLGLCVGGGLRVPWASLWVRRLGLRFEGICPERLALCRLGGLRRTCVGRSALQRKDVARGFSEGSPRIGVECLRLRVCAGLGLRSGGIRISTFADPRPPRPETPSQPGLHKKNHNYTRQTLSPKP